LLVRSMQWVAGEMAAAPGGGPPVCAAAMKTPAPRSAVASSTVLRVTGALLGGCAAALSVRPSIKGGGCAPFTGRKFSCGNQQGCRPAVALLIELPTPEDELADPVPGPPAPPLAVPLVPLPTWPLGEDDEEVMPLLLLLELPLGALLVLNEPVPGVPAPLLAVPVVPLPT
jgi:hypothetical protein